MGPQSSTYQLSNLLSADNFDILIGSTFGEIQPQESWLEQNFWDFLIAIQKISE